MMPSLTRRHRSLGMMYVIIAIFLLPLILNSINAGLSKPMRAPVLNFVYYCMNFTIMCAILWDYLQKAITYARKYVKKCLIWAGLGLGAYYLTSFLMSFILRQIDPEFANINYKHIAGQLSESYWLIAIGTVLLVPTAEELMHRGLVFGILQENYPAMAYVISALFFASIHVMGYAGAYSPSLLLMCFVQYLPAGFILAFCFEKSSCILTSIAIHTAVNLIGLLALR